MLCGSCGGRKSTSTTNRADVYAISSCGDATCSAPPLLYFLTLAGFFLAGFTFAFTAALEADFFLPNTLSQFSENLGVGAVRTMGPDIVV